MARTTEMKKEIAEIPAAVARLLGESSSIIADIGGRIRETSPRLATTVARGSSDHACLFLKYAIELSTGIPVASLSPSLASVYGIGPRLSGAITIAVSQSGRSPDIVAMMGAARRGGALTVALANTVPSPLGDSADCALDIRAGPEKSVAATKSFVNSVAAGLAILAEWTRDDRLAAAVRALPDALDRAVGLDWTRLGDHPGPTDSLYILGRGPAHAIASEAALKFKETCGVHAEAYSAAEVLHGPVELVGSGFPVLALAARDAAEQSVVAVATGLAEKGARVHVTSDHAPSRMRLPFVPTGHPFTDALTLIVPFYGFVESWSRAVGRDPDRPANLRKVTETL